jgi:hypothetical protein
VDYDASGKASPEKGLNGTGCIPLVPELVRLDLSLGESPEVV